MNDQPVNGERVDDERVDGPTIDTRPVDTRPVDAPGDPGGPGGQPSRDRHGTGAALWPGVRERVAALAAAPEGGRVFGATGHGWALEAPLTGGELADLEARSGTRLPEEYRTFLTEVGAGGAGPAYGVFPVRLLDGRWEWEGDGADIADWSLLDRPFPGGPDPARTKALMSERPDEDEFATEDAFEEAYDAWDERWAALMFDPAGTAGALAICHLGCAQREWLVVTGPHRGTIWSDFRADDGGLEPLRDPDGRPVTFARWYLDWLAAAERTAAGEEAPA
jgi:hypothetical protein